MEFEPVADERTGGRDEVSLVSGRTVELRLVQTSRITDDHEQLSVCRLVAPMDVSIDHRAMSPTSIACWIRRFKSLVTRSAHAMSLC